MRGLYGDTMNQPIVGPSAMSVGGGNRQAAGVNPALANRYQKTAGAVQTSMGVMTPVDVKAPERHNVKRKKPTEDERRNFATLREAGGGQKEMVPEVVGEGYTGSRRPYVVANNTEAGIMGVKVWRQASAEAQLLVWQGEMPEPWMLYKEGGTYQPPEQFEAQQKKAAVANAPVAPDEELGLLDDVTEMRAPQTPALAQVDNSEQILKLQTAVREARQEAKNMREAYELEKQKREQMFDGSYRTLIDVEGFGELEGSCDYYEIRGNVLVLGYDNAAKRHIPNPKPSGDKSVAQFILELTDGEDIHIFELASTFDSRFTFEAAGAAGVTFQQFLILRQATKPVTA